MTDLEKAKAASREGRHDDAIDAYRRALADQTLSTGARLLAMADLASMYCLAKRWELAETAARAAGTAAAGDPRSEAYALLAIGTRLLMRLGDEKAANPDAVFAEAMTALQRAGKQYEDLGAV